MRLHKSSQLLPVVRVGEPVLSLSGQRAQSPVSGPEHRKRVVDAHLDDWKQTSILNKLKEAIVAVELDSFGEVRSCDSFQAHFFLQVIGRQHFVNVVNDSISCGEITFDDLC